MVISTFVYFLNIRFVLYKYVGKNYKFDAEKIVTINKTQFK